MEPVAPQHALPARARASSVQKKLPKRPVEVQDEDDTVAVEEKDVAVAAEERDAVVEGEVKVAPWDEA